jgi:hypothetical protein
MYTGTLQFLKTRLLPTSLLSSVLTHTLFIGLIVGGLPALSWSAKPVSGFTGKRVAVTEKNLIPHMSKLDGYGEKYTFVAQIGQRDRFYFSMLISNMGPGEHKMQAKGTLTLKGKKYSWNFEKDADEWTHNKKKLYIKAGNAVLSGTLQDLKFDVRANKTTLIEVHFKPLVQPWTPLGGSVRFNHKLRTEYHLIPLASVSGKVWSDPVPTPVLFSGKGWGTHSWSHLGPHEQNRWVMELKGIDYQKEYTVYLREFETASAYERKTLSYVVVTHKDQVIFEGFNQPINRSRVFIDKKHTNQYKVPEAFTLDAKDCCKDRTLKLTFDGKKRTHYRNPIARRSWLVRKVIERFSKPMEYAYKGSFSIDIKDQGKTIHFGGQDGKLEVNHFNR